MPQPAKANAAAAAREPKAKRRAIIGLSPAVERAETARDGAASGRASDDRAFLAAMLRFAMPLELLQLAALARQAVAAWIDDYAPSMGAALAYYTLFSIAPLLLIVISIAGLVFGADAARGQIFAQLRELMGEEGAAAVQSLLQSVNKPAQGVLAHDRRRRRPAARRDVGVRRAAELARPHLARAARAPAVPACGRWCARACCRSA